MELMKSAHAVESFECRDIDCFANHSPERPFALPAPPDNRDARPAQAPWKIAAPKIFKTALPRPKNAPSLTVAPPRPEDFTTALACPTPKNFLLSRPAPKQKSAAPCIHDLSIINVLLKSIVGYIE